MRPMEEQLFETCRENRVDHLERLLQKPLDPNGEGLLLILCPGGLCLAKWLCDVLNP